MAVWVWARRGADIDLERELKAGADPDKRDFYGNTALIEAARAGTERCASILLSAGADPDGKDADGQTPLMKAARFGNEHCLRELLKGGADPSLVDREGETALMHAIRSGYFGIMGRMAEALLSAGADWKARNQEGLTAEELAREMLRDEVEEMLKRTREAAEERERIGGAASDPAGVPVARRGL